MIVCQEHKFVYMAPKKTGSTSMRTMLADHFITEIWKQYEFKNIQDNSARPDWRSYGADWKHVCELPEQFADFFIFATVRNPYHMEVSRYRHDIKHGYTIDTFEEFLYKLSMTSESPSLYRKLRQHSDYKPPAGCIRYDLNAVIKLETINQELQKLPFYKEGMIIQHLNKSRAAKPIYTKDAAKFVADAYKEDFEFFQYDVDSWKSIKLITMI